MKCMNKGCNNEAKTDFAKGPVCEECRKIMHKNIIRKIGIDKEENKKQKKLGDY